MSPAPRVLAALIVVALVGLSSAFVAPSEKGKPSRIDVALAEAFPGCEVERVACKLDKKQQAAVAKRGGLKSFKKGSTFAYVARKKGKVIGTAFFDSHVVRTKRETVLVAVDPAGKLLGVDTIVFQEPQEYIAQDSFYASLEGRGIAERKGRDLTLGRGLDGTTGATLTCAAVATASRRVLALHAVLGTKVGAEAPVPKKGDAKKSGTAKGKGKAAAR